MTRPIGTLFATMMLGAALGAPGMAHAADDATLNQCWGELTKQFQASGEPGLGEHANADSGFTPDPGDGGRRGVGNVSKEDFDDVGLGDIDLSDGAQGVHANEVGMGFPECDGPPVP